MSIVRMPEVATGTGSAAIQTWLVAAGDSVSAGQVIVELETEKAVVDYEVELDGIFAGTLLAEGESADVGTPIAVIAVEGQSVEDAMQEARAESCAANAAESGASAVQAEPEEVQSETERRAEPVEQHAPTPGATSAPVGSRSSQDDGADRSRGGRQFMSPLVRRLAREQGIDLTGIVGSGPNGRIVRRDLEQHSAPSAATAAEADGAAALPAQPAGTPSRDVADARTGSTFIEIPHTGMRQAIARRLAESKATVPHFYLTANCRVDDLLTLRSQLNSAASAKISVNDLVVKAAAWALEDVPGANATWTDEAVRRYEHADISVAVALPTGLVTPVLRGVEQMSVSEVSAGIRDLAGRAREGRLKQHEIEGGAFSVSNLGMYGVGEFAAIINPPQAGILAVGAATRQPAVSEDGEIQVATVMRVTLSVDHRVIDGAIAAEWLAAFTKRIENPLSILI
ncbi:pyruvate dehydrogenase complex dihydrolipoamide acetyltransferase [Streptomyces sp. 6N223]|uniref:pyruvate dehydrogenase complex dihydrolipoamide acetyltransferase n=1 Tax=Streptomyces sp. 6N223 TaxID=3457412 RepID=UPI003FD3D122